MSKAITKAVFPVAGYGTRFLPATKAMPKELLPIVDKPLIQYAAEEAIAAGIDTLIFVTGRNKRAIEDHFDSNNELEAMLREKGNVLQAEMVRNIVPQGVQCIFVRQAEQLGLGHAVLCAERIVGDETFAVLLADNFLTGALPNPTQQLVSQYVSTEKSQLSVMEVNSSDISKFGVIIPNEEGNGITGIVEKPEAGEAPSNLGAIGRYVLTPNIFEILKNLKAGVGGEIQLSDAIGNLAINGCVDAVEFYGQFFDCGSIDGYVKAVTFEYKQRKTK